MIFNTYNFVFTTPPISLKTHNTIARYPLFFFPFQIIFLFVLYMSFLHSQSIRGCFQYRRGSLDFGSQQKVPPNKAVSMSTTEPDEKARPCRFRSIFTKQTQHCQSFHFIIFAHTNLFVPRESDTCY